MKKIFGGLAFVFLSRGLLKGLTRIRWIRKRFGITPRKQIDGLTYYISLLKQHSAKATFFIPANLLARYLTHIQGLESSSIEWGIHGYVHTDHSKLSRAEQKEQLTKAVNIFDAAGIMFGGFRAPYLRINDDTIQAVADTKRFSYVSTRTVLWDEIYGADRAYAAWMKSFYRPLLHSQAASCPAAVEDIVDIPVSLPDDDVLVDRELMSAASVARLWKQMLSACREKNEIFVLQLHPERINELGEVLVELIHTARAFNPPVWIATLGEVAAYLRTRSPDAANWPEPYRGVFCITGDIDCLTIGDFLIRLKEW